ncbi:hypothetical protein PoB_004769000 [Plakobranchus ocellatus]|uniref:Uncharacterized protein n=1 Tax=Plakobranchus ocellatus TaxID=259542 RepID=A0AAV4BNZ4_9GAST|nr:hypothetical protein PoB_004769000 [Plakobranchus ocellatus]
MLLCCYTVRQRRPVGLGQTTWTRENYIQESELTERQVFPFCIDRGQRSQTQSRDPGLTSSTMASGQDKESEIQSLYSAKWLKWSGRCEVGQRKRNGNRRRRSNLSVLRLYGRLQARTSVMGSNPQFAESDRNVPPCKSQVGLTNYCAISALFR